MILWKVVSRSNFPTDSILPRLLISSCCVDQRGTAAESVIFHEIDFCRVVTCRINENVLGNRANMSVNSKLFSHFSSIYPLRCSYKFLVAEVKLRLILKL